MLDDGNNLLGGYRTDTHLDTRYRFVTNTLGGIDKERLKLTISLIAGVLIIKGWGNDNL